MQESSIHFCVELDILAPEITLKAKFNLKSVICVQKHKSTKVYLVVFMGMRQLSLREETTTEGELWAVSGENKRFHLWLALGFKPSTSWLGQSLFQAPTPPCLHSNTQPVMAKNVLVPLLNIVIETRWQLQLRLQRNLGIQTTHVTEQSGLNIKMVFISRLFKM